MILDASAVLAILLGESDAGRYADAIEAADVRRISPINWMEVAIRIDRLGEPAAVQAFEDLMSIAEVRIASIDQDQARLARQAYAAFGKGAGHPAKLNLGDCFAYALARSSGEPLLAKGEEFRLTDIVCA